MNAPARLPRGIRNHNPGNLRKTPIKWRGEIDGPDVEFESFATDFDGIRAMALALRNYQRRHKLSTVRAIISRWAPSTENNTDSYVAAVAAHMGVDPDSPIVIEDQVMLTLLAEAVIRHENGRQPYESALIISAVKAALEA